MFIKNEQGDDFEELDAAAFLVRPAVYAFPFEPFDRTPGGASLGRIEWCVELLLGRRKDRFSGILISAKQTRDARYASKVYRVKASVYDIAGSPLGKSGDYFRRVWRVARCPIHNTAIHAAYPTDEECFLVVEAREGSRIYFSKDLP